MQRTAGSGPARAKVPPRPQVCLQCRTSTPRQTPSMNGRPARSTTQRARGRHRISLRRARSAQALRKSGSPRRRTTATPSRSRSGSTPGRAASCRGRLVPTCMPGGGRSVHCGRLPPWTIRAAAGLAGTSGRALSAIAAAAVLCLTQLRWPPRADAAASPGRRRRTKRGAACFWQVTELAGGQTCHRPPRLACTKKASPRSWAAGGRHLGSPQGTPNTIFRREPKASSRR